MAEEPGTKHTYRVVVEDNFHHMDEGERYELGEFPGCPEAIAACKRIVDDVLRDFGTNEMTSERLWELYTMFGDDPFIVSTDRACRFSGWQYARARCAELFPDPGAG